MLLYLAARIVSSATAFLYPGYASYKTLSQRPASEEEIERWLMYWSVLGCIVGVEYLFEWLVSWIPFYYSLKSLFLLYLALPQTQGASYIYTAHLQPFFHAHERQIDNTLAQLKARAYRFVQDRLRALWDAATASLQGQQPNAAGAQQQQPNTGGRGLAPTAIVGSLWRAYGPSIMASGAALLRSAPPPSTSTFRTPPPTTFSNSKAEQSLLDRRRKLAAELAALDTIIPSRSSSSASTSEIGFGLRERTNSGSGRFEEIEVPSDVEGYEVGDNHDNDNEGGQGHVRPAVQGRASWFGWASGSSKGYERIKSE
ncbi:Receptor expression-enhancing protein 4 [Termitomyces sp. T112]|nr:Receptor expression-enhancing protein 4 [Termitomyces sp. T112]KAH0581010.1 hypothetical protein H2248_012156 [Termitomyces sp. 'cryptogamus']KNZ79127.1 Receptor expression-enhancing protein 4 [Termitomyces sp. J132]